MLEKDFIEIATDFLRLVSGEIDPFVSQKGEIYVNSNTSVTLSSPQYAQWAKYGRGAGKVPFQVIFDWVKKNSIQFEGLSERSTAWAITKSISKKGTLNYVPNAPDVFEEAVQLNLRSFQEEVSKELLNEINIEVMSIYNKTIGKDITFKI